MPGQPYFSMMAPGLIISLRQLGFQWKTLTGGNHQTHVQSKTCIVHQYKNFNMILHHELNCISFNPNKEALIPLLGSVTSAEVWISKTL